MGAFFGPKDWGRLLTAMVTPFDAENKVNLAEAQRIATHLVDVQKNDGLVINGTTGESPTTHFDEKLALLSAVIEAVGDRAAIMFGAGTYSTEESIELTKMGTSAGAHGIMLVNPYYNRPGQAGLYAHFKTVAAETDLPVMLYNIQPRSSINLETATLLRLAEIKNIVAVKEASGNMSQISDVGGSIPEGFRLYSGDDGLTLPIMAVGGHGVVSVAGHVVGADIKSMIEAFLAGNFKQAAAIHHRLSPAYKALFSAPSPTPVKHVLARRGFDCLRVRLPLVEMSDAEKAVVEAAFGSALVHA